MALASVLAIGAPPGSAAAAGPTPEFQYAGIVGSEGAITLSHIPVVDPYGNIRHRDMQLLFQTDGFSLTLATGYPMVQPTPGLKTTNFVAGKYFLQSGKAIVYGSLVSGIGSGGSSVWTFTLASPPGYTPAPTQSIWQTGAPALDIQSRLTADKIPLDSSFSYGLSAQGSTDSCAVFPTNGVLAAQQVGATLSLYSFTYCGADKPTVVASVVLTMCANAACSNAP